MTKTTLFQLSFNIGNSFSYGNNATGTVKKIYKHWRSVMVSETERIYNNYAYVVNIIYSACFEWSSDIATTYCIEYHNCKKHD